MRNASHREWKELPKAEIFENQFKDHLGLHTHGKQAKGVNEQSYAEMNLSTTMKTPREPSSRRKHGSKVPEEVERTPFNFRYTENPNIRLFEDDDPFFTGKTDFHSSSYFSHPDQKASVEISSTKRSLKRFPIDGFSAPKFQIPSSESFKQKEFNDDPVIKS